MALLKLEDFDPNYHQTSSGDVKGFTVYTEETDEKIGSVSDVLVDESGQFRYLVVDFGLWIFNKQVMLPVDHSRVDTDAQRVYVFGQNRKQIEALPEYNDRILADDNHEAQAKRSRDNADDAVPVQKIEVEVNRIEAPVKQETVIIQPEPVDLGATVSAGEKATRSACLIFNPVAGQSDSEQDLATIQRILQPEFNLDVCMTTPEVDADQLAREAVDRGAEIIIASGGDGTLSAAAEVVVGTGVPLGIISRGTANAFATALGIPLAIEAACETILDGKTRVIDAADCNGKPMVLLAGIGFEAEAVERADREAKNRFGMLAYVLAGFEGLRNLKSFEARIETEDKVITLDAAAVTIANAAPPTSVLAQGPAELCFDDGLLDVTLVAPANSIGAIAAAYNLLQSARSAAITDRPDVGFLQARSIKVTTNPPQKVVLDGELIGYTPVEIECIPGGLTIFVPTVPEDTPTEKLEGLPNLRVELKE
jgi:YegS/Rv2252/BmrU family lipid kinase